MPRPSKEQVAENIRKAVVRATAAKGISGVSMADVAKEATVSAGTLYLHFDNKTDMLQQTYLHIKRAFYASLTASMTASTSAEKIRQLWAGMFAFVSADPQGFLFIDNTGAFEILTAEQAAEAQIMQEDIRQILADAISDGTLADLPLDVVTTLLTAPALLMARSSVMQDRTFSRAELELTFDRVWLSISASPTNPH